MFRLPAAQPALACSPYSRRGGGKIDSRASFLLQFREPPRKETELRLDQVLTSASPWSYGLISLIDGAALLPWLNE